MTHLPGSLGHDPSARNLGICVTAAPDWRATGYDDATRYTGHPANIRNVNIVIVARATRPSPDQTGDPVPALLNRPARPPDTYRRSIGTLSESPQNLLSRANMLPPVFAGSTNVGGG